MAVRFLFVLVLVLAALFAWRAWRHLPGLAVLAAGVAALMGVLLVKSPILAAIGLVLAAVIISVLGARPKR
jgi:hypothetical protein